MRSFLERHGESISGTINTFDRVIFKGHLNGFFPSGAFGRYLWQRNVLLKDAGRFFEAETRRIRDHIASVAAAAGRPVEYLAGASSHRSGASKEARARQIAERDGVTEGLVCVLSAVEPCRSFTVVPNRQTQRLEVVHRPRKCLHYYLYLIDPEFGWMHVRLQTWAPYEIQVYVNGRAWLARQLDRAGIGYQRSDNKITAVDDLAKALDLCQQFAHTDWPPFLDRQAALVNPLLPAITAARFPGYWWVIDQSEYASDILFTGRAALEAIRGDLVTAAITALGATDVMHFLGRKPHHAFAGEVTIDSKQRRQGCRVRFRLKANAVKFYDHANVFRVETTINNPREFKVLRSPEDATDQQPRWCPMTKGVANFWRYAEVAHAANARLLNALARVPLKGEATSELDALCRPATATGTRVAAFNPVHPDTADLFAAVLSGDFVINGFRNRDLQGKLYPAAATDAAETKRRTHRTSRLIAKLRGHGLITRIKNSRLYRLTTRGLKAMWPSVRFRRIDFPADFLAAQDTHAA
ncbi:MAG: hypothetical protein WCA12_11370 [Burkholderiales bacterium]